jgi:hypothetical protein
MVALEETLVVAIAVAVIAAARHPLLVPREPQI